MDFEPLPDEPRSGKRYTKFFADQSGQGLVGYDGDVFTALTVYCKGGLKQQIFQSIDPNKKYTSGTGNFSGYYGIAGFEGEKLTSIYLGKGTEISHSGYSLKSKTPEGSANLTANGKSLVVSYNQETEVGLPLMAK